MKDLHFSSAFETYQKPITGNEMIEQITSITIRPYKEPIFSQNSYKVEISDEGAGQFINIYSGISDNEYISIEAKDWNKLRAVIGRMVETVNEYNKNKGDA